MGIQLAALHLFLAVTGEAGEGLVDGDDPTVGVDEDDALAGVAEYGGRQLWAEGVDTRV
jgi:hypothetical protein